ncbi:MAG: nitronate monooxygenase [Promethearchaeota archaeon]|nr:MAG: nitronate monooxygenase [Candidatus Lokiarchaeota archaeon]
MIKTKVTEILGIKNPIICGTMMALTGPEFTAVCSNAGGLGILASAIYRKPEPLREALQKLKSLTKEPFAVNMNLFPMLKPPNQKRHLKVMIDEGVKIIETSGHEAPEKFLHLFREHDIIWMHKCAGVRYAEKAASLGADIVEVVGWENGGHVGKFDIGTFVLTPATVDAVDIPVIAGGGVVDGRGLVAALALGAEGVLIGSRLLITKECPIHDNLKEALLGCTPYDTAIVLRSVNNALRVWHNPAAQNILELEESGAPDTDLFKAASGMFTRQMYEEGDVKAGMMTIGQGLGLCDDIPTVKELIERVVNQAEEIMRNLRTS